MKIKQPENMDELVYFTRRSSDEGKIMAWVFKKSCDKCDQALMGKPKGDNGKVKIRAKEYVCEKCGNTEPKKEHEESLNVNISYTCGACEHKGETQVPYLRKTFQGVKSIVFTCAGCDKSIPITKKMKAIKKK